MNLITKTISKVDAFITKLVKMADLVILLKYTAYAIKSDSTTKYNYASHTNNLSLAIIEIARENTGYILTNKTKFVSFSQLNHY